MKVKNLHIYILRHGLPVLAALITCLTSCVKETGVDPAYGNSDVLLQLNMPVAFSGDIQDINLPHEDLIEVLHVLAFEPLTGKFIELLEAEEYEYNTVTKNPVYKVRMKPGTYDLVLLANCEDIIDACYPSGIAEDYLRSNIIKELILTVNGVWVTADNAYRAMPIWGEKNNVTVAAADPGADLRGSGNQVPLIRMTARIDVVMAPEVLQKSYKLHSVRVYNHRAKGQVIPDAGKYFFNYTTKWEFSIYNPSIPDANNGKIVGPLYYDVPKEQEEAYEAGIYLFETEAKDAIDPAEPLDYTCLVLGIGKESNQGGGASRANAYGTLYYRVDFINGSDQYRPILRNHKYVVTVKGILSEGFTEYDRAYRSKLYDLSYDIQEWEMHSAEVEMPGTYRLDISSTLLEADGGNLWGTVYISTTHPDGWYAALSDDPNDKDAGFSGDWLELFPTPGTVLPAGQTIEQFINFYTSDTNSVAYLHIVSGNLTNVIKLTQLGTTVD